MGRIWELPRFIHCLHFAPSQRNLTSQTQLKFPSVLDKNTALMLGCHQSARVLNLIGTQRDWEKEKGGEDPYDHHFAAANPKGSQKGDKERDGLSDINEWKDSLSCEHILAHYDLLFREETESGQHSTSKPEEGKPCLHHQREAVLASGSNLT